SQLNPPDGSNDHQTVGAGPYPAALAAALANPVNKGDAVYYCGQAGYVLAATGAAYCSRSDDGGLNFNKSVIAYQDVVSGCAQSIHGHVKVGPDGTVYLPNASCNGNVAVAVSMDAGTTWTLKQVPNTIPTPAILDPSVAIANDNTVYLFFIGKPAAGSADGHVYAAKSTDHGDTWSAPVDIGASAGIANAVFPTGVAGDGDRAACGFLGTTTSGDHQNKDFKGTWYGFVAHTYDGGKTWVTVDATPSGPVQREACIWNGGGNNVCRNLLDFVDITKDSKGRVLFGMADGCINECETGGPNSYSAKALMARQSGGKGLLKQFDPVPVEPVQPAPPCLFGRRDDSASYLKWVTPDTGGSEITQYKIFRAAAAGGPAGTETQVGVAGGNKNTFTDRSVDPSVVKYTYRITALNARGESIPSNSVDLTITPRVEATGACGLPGVQVISDPTGDETDTLAQHDITSVSLSEPPGFPNKLIFTIKVASLPSIPPGWRWAVRFSVEGVTPPTDATGGPSEDFFVSMVTSDGPTPTFTYGVTSVPQNAARVFTTIGDLDAASNANADGTITLVIDKANIGSPKAGQGIVGLLGSVRATAPSAIPGSGGTNETIPDSTGGGSYQLRSANLCLPNTAPVARLTANKDEGDKPLSVTFDGSASSDPDKNDKIATYIFNLGDGSDDIVQATPTLTHNFNKTGEYLVRMVVIDSRGKTSDNTAQWFLEVNDPNVVNPTPTPGSTATPTPGQSPTPGPSATPTPSTSPSATPVQRAQLLNISTRLRVETGDNALIGGFIVTGGSKSVLLRAIGPSLNDKGTPLAGRIDDTVLELHGPSGALITTNDNWKDAPNRADIEATGIPPKDDRESAILRSLAPGKYTAIVRGKNDTTGIALVEAYDLAPSGSQLANISTRGLVETGDDVMIGGFISGNQTGPSKLLVRALGPSLSNQLPNALDDPTLELYDANGTTLAVDDDWKDVQASEIQDTGIPPSNDLESAIVRMLPAGKYTAVVRGVHNHTGSALVEVYNLP
ncbi:MAG: PKD domain-containing protein, partial [Chthoniobacterales bacterium]